MSNKVDPLDTSKEGLVPKDVIKEIKENVDLVTNLLIESSVNNNNTNPQIFYETNTFTVQIYNTYLSSDSNINIQIKKGLSLIDFNDCAKNLKSFYNLTQEVIIKKVDYNPKLESRNNIGDISYKFYSPVDGSELSYKNACDQDPIVIKIPLKETPISKDLIEEYKEQNFNPYDSKGYTNRCLQLINSTSGGDITVSDRIERIYQNFTISCGDNCLLIEIETNNNYTVCNCTSTSNPIAFLEKVLLGNSSLFNIEIFKCYENISKVF